MNAPQDHFNAPSGMTLSLWQKRQAALQYHFTSLDYLKGLKKRIDALIQGADALLDLVKEQGRDALLVDARWGARDTSANWSTYGFSALTDFQQATARDIAKRSRDAYSFTGANQCAHMLGELSMRWSTPEEEEQFKALCDVVFDYAYNIDYVVKRPSRLWDGNYYTIWKEQKASFPRLPKFRVRADLEAVTGTKPPRTGVYVPQDDPYGALQFGWVGGEWDGSLDDCCTFNALGLEAIAAVGRNNLWNDSPDLLAYVKQRHLKDFGTFLREEGGMYFEESMFDDPGWASAFVSGRGSTSRPSKWYYVELLDGEFDDAGETEEPGAPAIQRVAAGLPCPQAGWWLTPARENSRKRFQKGEIFPAIEGNTYGATFWLWAGDQSG